jgi:hypothetical protein
MLGRVSYYSIRLLSLVTAPEMLYSSLLAGYLCASPLSSLALFPSCLCPSCRFPVTFSRLSGFNLFLPYLRSCRFLINHLICVYLLKVCLTIHLSCLLRVFSPVYIVSSYQVKLLRLLCLTYINRLAGSKYLSSLFYLFFYTQYMVGYL